MRYSLDSCRTMYEILSMKNPAMGPTGLELMMMGDTLDID
jgi:hypothetical protein